MKNIVEEILSTLPQKKSAHTITLSGDLGAGKTSFVKALAKELGVVEHVTSPTFVIMKKYSVEGHYLVKTLIHIDAYRVEDINEMDVIGLEDLVKEEGSMVCIEWPEKIKSRIPEEALHISITTESDHSRTITYGD